MPSILANFMPLRGRSSTVYCPDFQSGSEVIISLCKDLNEMENGLDALAVEISNSCSQMLGYFNNKPIAVIPPIEGPTTAFKESIPKCFKTSFVVAAISSKANFGNSRRYGSSVLGLILAGPVEPKQLPKELAQITKY